MRGNTGNIASGRVECRRSRGRAPTPIRHNDPPDAAPPATRYGTASSKRERPIESAATDTELAGSSKTWHTTRGKALVRATGIAAFSTHSSETAGQPGVGLAS